MAEYISRAEIMGKITSAEMQKEFREMTGQDAYAIFIRMLNDMPAADAVPVGVLEQVRWERDIAIEQLESYGVSFGRKADCVGVVRCKDCKRFLDFDDVDCVCVYLCKHMGYDDFCSHGERRSDD